VGLVPEKICKARQQSTSHFSSLSPVDDSRLLPPQEHRIHVDEIERSLDDVVLLSTILPGPCGSTTRRRQSTGAMNGLTGAKNMAYSHPVEYDSIGWLVPSRPAAAEEASQARARKRRRRRDIASRRDHISLSFEASSRRRAGGEAGSLRSSSKRAETRVGSN